eukprot:CAMPEP_0198593526 /NCGR_PEP_ID=MMETSP1462-20131121/139507_1 /TAXON_ID=1333877 /ORGANISM="Brandtodinium nutriculum, Strain RCC3387" /LENGTH=86 /DNA_ID=CAMNT_0044325129 /DNA_START=116 /DNA_END=373 /DNA_ORIENTATION=+
MKGCLLRAAWERERERRVKWRMSNLARVQALEIKHQREEIEECMHGVLVDLPSDPTPRSSIDVPGTVPVQPTSYGAVPRAGRPSKK